LGLGRRCDQVLCEFGGSWSRGVVIVCVALCGFGLMGSSAFGAFRRPFVRSIEGTPTGPGGSLAPFSEPGGVAVDSVGNLWMGDGREILDEFNRMSEFIGPEPGPGPLKLKGLNRFPEGVTPPRNLAIDYSTGDLYVTAPQSENAYPPAVEVFNGTGGIVKLAGWEERIFGKPAHVVVDNSFFPLAGPVYVSHGDVNPGRPSGDGLPAGVERFSTAGGPVEFEGAKRCQAEKCEYIVSNEIVGVPGELFNSSNRPTPEAVAVDGAGDIYVADPVYNGEHPGKAVGAVVEFTREGFFVRAFTGEAAPGCGERPPVLGKGTDALGGESELGGVAFDPVSGHVLVAVRNRGAEEGAIDEFDSSSGCFLDQMKETAPGEHLASALEMAVDTTGVVYVVDGNNRAVVVYGPGLSLPSVKLAEPSGRGRERVVVNGLVDPAGLKLEDCHFEYVTEAEFEASGEASFAFGSKVPCVPAAGSLDPKGGFQAVSATVTGLVSGVTYRYRLVASTEGLLGGSSASSPLAFTAQHAPRVDSMFVTNISSMFADLHAAINPLGADTVYRFEYVDAAGYEPAAADPYAAGASAPVTAVDIGSGGLSGAVDASVVQQVGGLTAGTTYHFRVLAESEIEGNREVTLGRDQTFATLPPVVSGLPDERRYELLTPPDKGSAEDMFSSPETERHFFDNKDVGYPSGSGEEFLLETKAAFGPFAASGGNAYVFKRETNGWRASSLASPSLGVQSTGAEVFGPADFSQIGISNLVGSQASLEGTSHLSLIGSPGGPYTTIQAEATGGKAVGTAMVGASHDLSRIVLETTDHALCPGDEAQDPATHALCEWSAGEFKLVSVKSSGRLFGCGALLGQSRISGPRRNAVSADGSRIFFTAPDPYVAAGGTISTKECWNGAESNVPQLYMRSKDTTIPVSLPEAGWSPVGRVTPSIYAGASEDGSRVFFVSETELTKDDAGNNINNMHDPELYEYSSETGKLMRVSAGESGKTAGKVYTVPAINADGSVVYFTAFGQLAAGAPSVSEHEVNLYRYDVQTNTTVYVGTVDNRDYPSSADVWWRKAGGILPNEIALASNASWYTTPDGRYLLFISTSDLTGYSTAQESVGDCPVLDNEGEKAPFGHCTEVYRYDSVGRNIVCVSCDASGARPVSNAFFGHGAGGNAPAAGPVRAMTDDGSYVFFDTADPLVPQDSNGTLDVYEWHGGRVSLISSGQDPAASFLLGTSAAIVNGEDMQAANVFFGTHARLVPQDTDTAGDLYDARVKGGFGVVGRTGPCEGNACQNPSPAPIETSPGSFTFSGPGDVASEVHQPSAKKKIKHRKAKSKKTKARKRVRKAKTRHSKRRGRAAA
jgi:hypothetical protein